nr:HAD hydrolase-like protein [Bacteroidota bacterium]
RALSKAKATPDISMMVGDTFEADIVGAEGVGMDTLFFNYRNETLPAHYKVVDAIGDIKKHL